MSKCLLKCSFMLISWDLLRTSKSKFVPPGFVEIAYFTKLPITSYLSALLFTGPGTSTTQMWVPSTTLVAMVGALAGSGRNSFNSVNSNINECTTAQAYKRGAAWQEKSSDTNRTGIKNTSLAAQGALAHRLQRRTACKIQNGRQWAQKWPTGSGKVSTPRFWGILSNFHQISFLIRALLLWEK